MYYQKKFIFAIMGLLYFSHLFAQQDTSKTNDREQSISVFLDCVFCDEEYIRQNLTFVNYVRDTKEAQVHILGTWQATGSGGDEYTFFFIGQKEFKGMKDTLVVNARSDATREEVRSMQLKTMELGLVHYVAKTPMAKNIVINYGTENANEEEEIVEDKWKSWVFDIGSNAWLSGQESYKSININSYLEVSKVTPDIKIEFELSHYYNEDKFIIGEEEIVSINKGLGFDHLLVKSINNHWSAGYDINTGSSSYRNFDFYVETYPSIEYNLFPYDQSSRRQLRFLYGIGAAYYDYTDTTIYNQTEELLGRHRLTIAFEMKERWGSISTSVRGSQYFYDFTKNNLRISSSIRLRIVKGLQLRLYGSYALIHDQLSLPKGGASEEEILLRQKELATQYRYWGSVGLNYTFGSIYNNVVNPRFGD